MRICLPLVAFSLISFPAVFGQTNGDPPALPSNVPATSVTLFDPSAVAADGIGNFYFVDHDAIYRVDKAGILTRFAGTGVPGYSGDEGPATSAQIKPWQIAADAAGNVFVADWGNNRIRKISGGVITTIAGNGRELTGSIPAVPPGNNGPATSAPLGSPTAIGVDPAGDVYFSDAGAFIRKISDGIITRIAGCGTCYTGGLVTSNGPAISNTSVGGVEGIAVDAGGEIYYSLDECDYFSEGTVITAGSKSSGCVTVNAPSNRVKKLSNGVITNFAGNGTTGFAGDNGPAGDAEFNDVGPIALDAAGNLYVADLYNGRIRKISGGNITTIAGSGTFGFAGDNGPALAAQLGNPHSLLYGIAAEPGGNLYIADVGNKRIRKISNGVITTVAGGSTMPSIMPGGVVPVGSTISSAEPGSWLTIYGSNFTDKVYSATNSLPTTLGGITVTIHGKPAFLSYVSPTQINCQAPDDVATGPVPVVVTTNTLTASSTVTLLAVSPSFSLFDDGKHAAGVIPTPTGTGAYASGTYDLPGPAGAFSFNTRPAKPGDVLVLFGVGFGPTTPHIPAGQIFSGSAPTDFPVTITIGGVPASVQYSGITSAGLYQFNIVVPNVPGGDQPLLATVNGVQSPARALVTVQP